MQSDKQYLFLTTLKKWVSAKKSGQIPHSVGYSLHCALHRLSLLMQFLLRSLDGPHRTGMRP